MKDCILARGTAIYIGSSSLGLVKMEDRHSDSGKAASNEVGNMSLIGREIGFRNECHRKSSHTRKVKFNRAVCHVTFPVIGCKCGWKIKAVKM